MKYYSITDIGKVREINEDNYANYIGSRFSLFVVADGMGGHNAGEVASKLAVESVRDYVIKNKNTNDFEKLSMDSMKYANDQIIAMANKDQNLENMGTTAVSAIVHENKCYVSNVGDSRLYLIRDGKISQITKDHSYVQELIDEGLLTLEEAKFFSKKNYITNALGSDNNDFEIAIYTVELKNKDRVLLVTDGLTSMVDDDEILDLFSLDLDLKETAEILVYMANSMGGYDNITLTLFTYEEE
ncbi:MAG: Stp1/IreP family PP2C-type Ser/Thr phosphatase [Tissierellia bacterium]|nr:Stp1/IreP family PP2C-type Ser/Thr phosphatase [Tissierellia bacterium]